jgi:putative Mg2+ transporter-C (MgtC) family protein
MGEIIWSELTSGLPDAAELAHVVIRLLASVILGALIGWQREASGKAAGLRTHVLVALGTTLFVLAASGSGMSLADVSRIIQGISAGIGFIGAGAILKLTATREIEGLTTAAGIWMTAAIGVAVGLGGLGLALLGSVLTWLVLASIGLLETRAKRRADAAVPEEDQE